MFSKMILTSFISLAMVSLATALPQAINAGLSAAAQGTAVVRGTAAIHASAAVQATAAVEVPSAKSTVAVNASVGVGSSVSLGTREVAPVLSLTNSQWIWTGEEAGAGGNAPIGDRAFRKSLTCSEYKTPICATILITTDNNYTLYVNGVDIGSTPSIETSFQAAQSFHVALQASNNLFAVLATNSGGPAAVIATISVEYSDGSTDTIVTDGSWKTFVGSVPAGFQDPSTDDSSWPSASVQGKDGVAPWGLTAIPPALDLTQSNWIWTSENQNGVAPVGSRAFRKTIVTPSGGYGYGKEKCAICATIVIDCDNEYTLYVNGDAIGSGNNFPTSQAYIVTSLAAKSNVFAVLGTNTATVPNPAGLIATILITYSDGTSETFITDTTWRTFIGTAPSNFTEPAIDDSTWSDAIIVGKYGDLPWGDVTVPPA